MIIDNPPIVQLVLDGIYAGPASLRGGVVTFLYRGSIQQRRGVKGSIDGVAGRFAVERIDGFDEVSRPFLQASLIGDA